MKTDCRLPIADCRLLKSEVGARFSFSIGNRKSEIKNAFTLIELLVVIAILGILAGLAVPALKNLGKSNVTAGATRQLLDAVGRARQLAMADRTTVYMVFLPTNFWNNPVYSNNYGTWWSSLTADQRTAVTNLCDKQLSGYAFIAYGAMGDQPGQHQWHYLAPWQSLPEGTFIGPEKFAAPGTIVSSRATPLFQNWNADYPHSDNNTIWAFTNMVAVPFPSESTNPSSYLSLPCIAFNYLGQLTFDSQNPQDIASRDEYIPLARGSVSPAIDSATKLYLFDPSKVPPYDSPSVLETPIGNSTNIAYNIVHIDALTGRATLEYHKVR